MWWIIGSVVWLIGFLFIWAICYSGGKEDEAMEKEIERIKQQREAIDIVQMPKEPEVKTCDFDE